MRMKITIYDAPKSLCDMLVKDETLKKLGVKFKISRAKPRKVKK